MRLNNPLYIISFAGTVCVICSLFVSSAATFLKDKQALNVKLDRQRKILAVTGLAGEGASLSAKELQDIFANRIQVQVVNLSTGEPAPADRPELAPGVYDQQRAKKDPALSATAPKNPAQVVRVPLYGEVMLVMSENGTEVEQYVLPIEGKGLWSTLYGFLALDKDLETIRGLTFYQHGETPGLGGEVDNPAWKAKWPKRKAFDENGNVAIHVIKGVAGPPEKDPHHVDGLSGATITSNGVTNLLQFWLGENGYGPYIARARSNGSTT